MRLIVGRIFFVYLFHFGRKGRFLLKKFGYLVKLSDLCTRKTYE